MEDLIFTKGDIMNYTNLAAEILKYVGGQENIIIVTNCMTRLRFQLKDSKKANVEAIKNLKGVQGAVTKNGQFQIIIGTDVSHVCEEIKKLGHFDDNAEPSGEAEKTGIINSFFGTLTAIFTPVIPALAGSGMIKALLALCVVLGVITNDSNTYKVFFAFADALFTFMPFILAISAAKRFKCSPYIAAVLAGVLLHSSFTGIEAQELIINIFNGNTISLKYFTIFGFLPILAISYGGSVIPILLIVWVQSKIEPIANKYSFHAVKVFLAPLITIILTGLIALFIAGPIGNLIGQILAVGFNFLNDYAGWVIPLIMGTLCPFFVMTGMHYCFAPIQSIQYATLGYGTILGPGMLASNIAQGTSSIVVGLKSKNKELKQLGISAGFTGLMGITEPALYGVNLKYKKPLYAAMIGGGCAGLYAGITGIHTFSSTTAGLLALPVYIGGEGFMNLINACITILISMVVTVIATLILGFKDPVEVKADEVKAENNQEVKPLIKEKLVLGAPLSGQTISLSKVSDEAFSQGILGKGAAILPVEGKVYAPVNGKVETVFDTKHAIGLVSDEGVEILIHVGIDTVELGGKYYETKVKQGERVTKGQLLLEFDMDGIKKAGYDITTPIIVSNTEDFLEVLATDKGTVKAKDDFITILP
ncbi:MAG: bglP [Anaerocolumna sp.]|jgi:PTS system beta-glucosides-specific IIC component|nr:bglP [Anaerocolumna sp.]